MADIYFLNKIDSSSSSYLFLTYISIKYVKKGQSFVYAYTNTYKLNEVQMR